MLYEETSMNSFAILQIVSTLLIFHDRVSTTYLLVELESQPSGEVLKSAGRNAFVNSDSRDPPFDPIHYIKRGLKKGNIAFSQISGIYI